MIWLNYEDWSKILLVGKFRNSRFSSLQYTTNEFHSVSIGASMKLRLYPVTSRGVYVYRVVFLQGTWFLRIQKLVLMSRKICTWAQFKWTISKSNFLYFHIKYIWSFKVLKNFKNIGKLCVFAAENRVPVKCSIF